MQIVHRKNAHNKGFDLCYSDFAPTSNFEEKHFHTGEGPERGADVHFFFLNFFITSTKYTTDANDMFLRSASFRAFDCTYFYSPRSSESRKVRKNVVKISVGSLYAKLQSPKNRISACGLADMYVCADRHVLALSNLTMFFDLLMSFDFSDYILWIFPLFWRMENKKSKGSEKSNPWEFLLKVSKQGSTRPKECLKKIS